MTGKEIINNVNSVKDGKYPDEKSQHIHAIVSGAAVGGMMGIYYGYSKDKNMLAMGILGAIIGSVVVRLFAQ
jgi:uncharacterized protein YcfJ